MNRAQSQCDDGPPPWSGPGPVAHPVFKTGGARQTALEGSTPSPFRMSLRDLRTVDRLATAVSLAELWIHDDRLLLDLRAPTDDMAREVAHAVRAVAP